MNFQLSEKFSSHCRKAGGCLGGFEYDEYPYRIYDYSDMNDWMDCYFTGVAVSYEPTGTQEICVQVTNGSDNRSKSPSFYNLGWNSSYLDEMLSLRYSVTAGQQAKGNWMWMVWGGQQVEAGKFLGYFDVMYTRGKMDRWDCWPSSSNPKTRERGFNRKYKLSIAGRPFELSDPSEVEPVRKRDVRNSIRIQG